MTYHPLFLSSLTLLLLLTNIHPTSQCKCPLSKELPRQLTSSGTFIIQPEKINDSETSLPILVSSLIHLQHESHINKNISSIPINPCPKGFRLPTQEEYESLITYAQSQGGVSFLTNPSGLAMTAERHYIVSPIIDDSFYNTLTFFTNETVVFEKQMIKTPSTALYAKCVRGISESYGIDGDVYVVPNDNVEYEMNTKNIKAILWAVDYQLYNSTKLSLSFKDKRCYLIESWMINMADNVVYSCLPVHVQNPTYNEIDTVFDVNKVQTITTSVNVDGSFNLFQTPGNAPIAAKNEGGFYVAYSESTTNDIHVIEYDMNFNEINNTNLNIKGRVIDITATDWGFALLHCSCNLYSEYVSGYFNDYTLRFNTVLFNNGKEPPVLKEQIMFHEGNSNTIVNGMNALTTAQNGRIVYTNGILSIIFAHQNNFHAGVDADFSSGDSFITMNSNGEDVKLAFAFKTTRSLNQALTFDGKYVVYAGLGDQTPENINACVMRVDLTVGSANRIYSSCNPYMSSTNIPGDTKGNSAGRFGGVVHGDDKYAIVYSTKEYNNVTSNEVGIIRFDVDDNRIVDVVKNVISGINGNEVVQIRSVKYGKNVLVMYAIASETVDGLLPKDDVVVAKVGYVLVDFNGKVISGPFVKEGSEITVNDDIRELNDGSVVWTSVTKGESGLMLNVHYVKV